LKAGSQVLEHAYSAGLGWQVQKRAHQIHTAFEHFNTFSSCPFSDDVNPHKAFPAGIGELFLSQWRNRRLIMQLTKRDVLGRYRGSLLGLAWSFFHPLIMLAVYTFVFSVVFKARWGVADEDKVSFAIIIFAGLIVHGIFAECINRAPSLIVNNPNYVKKVVFPVEILPSVALGSALFHAGVSLAVLLTAQLVLTQRLPWTVVIFPLVLLPLLLSTTGFAWLLSALGVYVRDVGQATGILTTVLMFLSPLFYPLSALPEKYRIWLHLNPLTFIIEEARNVLIFGRLPSWREWVLALVASTLISAGGFWWFQKTRKGFADVL
jgi:lipopolysaccharide transport system permease protein